MGKQELRQQAAFDAAKGTPWKGLMQRGLSEIVILPAGACEPPLTKKGQALPVPLSGCRRQAPAWSVNRLVSGA